jgi:hypothetical protein
MSTARNLVIAGTLALGLGASSRVAVAQAVVPPTEDARVLRKGMLRVRAATDWMHFNERWGTGTPGFTNGSLEPLGIDFNRDSIGPAEVEVLAPLQTTLRQLAGMPTLGVTLGRSVASLEGTIASTPISLELGVTSRLTVGVMAPFIETRTDVFLNPNPGGFEGNVGINPALETPAANAGFVISLDGATTALRNAIAACTADPSSAGCLAGVRANPAAAQALLASATALSAGVKQVYGTATGAGAPYVPVLNSDVQLAIDARIASTNAAFITFLGTPAGSAWIQGKPAAALARIGLSDMQRILTEQLFGFSADSLQTVERSHWGDIEVSAKFLLFDGFGSPTKRAGAEAPAGFRARAAIGGVFRLGSGQADLPSDFADIGTGDGQNDVEGRVATDLAFGLRLGLSLFGRYGAQLPDQQWMRITPPNRPVPAAYRLQKVDRDLGDYVELTGSPRFAFNEQFAISGHYTYFHKALDSYTGTVTTTDLAGNAITLDASVLGLETDATNNSIGATFAYSTLAAVERGHTRHPIEVFITHLQSIDGWNHAKVFRTRVELRYYIR